MIDIHELNDVDPLFAKELVPKRKGVYFWIDRSSGNVVYIGIAIGVNGLYNRIVRQHLNPDYLEYRSEKQTQKDTFQLGSPIKKMVKGEWKHGIDKSAFRKNIGRKLSIPPGTETLKFIHNNLYLKFYISQDVNEIKQLERKFIQKYQPCFNEAHKVKEHGPIINSLNENVNFVKQLSIKKKNQTMYSNEKQDKALVNTLITIADNSAKRSIAPESKSAKPTVVTTLYDVLKNHPYEFKQSEVFYEVHIRRLKKDPERLKMDRYKLQRSELCSLLGWGIHGDEEGRLALAPCDSMYYKTLLEDKRIQKKKAFNKK